eukprot:TRINITY_DN3958_c0_g1_i1.p1 TRINITY_DN3958_c0_g1~~TRINITY_DN3958_c0_g1_i1.p1  ORF type:complete len:429 (+),score=126.35 TRINITY_DN3958_c0_g1_i1:15-1301(+)
MERPVVNTRYCGTALVQRVCGELQAAGEIEVALDDAPAAFDLLWADAPSDIALHAKTLTAKNTVNHFSVMSELCVKHQLARNMSRMAMIFPEDYAFFPRTWTLPSQAVQLSAFAAQSPQATLILKPAVSCEGRGITLMRADACAGAFSRSGGESPPTVVQEYVADPLLIDGFKFDMRVYVLVVSINPLVVYLHKDGLVRMATDQYQPPCDGNLSCINMHLTNYTINKTVSSFAWPTTGEQNSGSKRSISWLMSHLASRWHDADAVWAAVADVVLKSLLAVQPMVSHIENTHRYGGFELLGFDILLDSHCRPWLLEVNQSPSLACDTCVDTEVKTAVIRDTFKLMRHYHGRRVVEGRRGVSAAALSHGGFRCLYPQRFDGADTTGAYARFLCFPFPEQLFDPDYLSADAQSALLTMLRSASSKKKKTAV